MKTTTVTIVIQGKIDPDDLTTTVGDDAVGVIEEALASYYPKRNGWYETVNGQYRILGTTK